MPAQDPVPVEIVEPDEPFKVRDESNASKGFMWITAGYMLLSAGTIIGLIVLFYFHACHCPN